MGGHSCPPFIILYDGVSMPDAGYNQCPADTHVRGGDCRMAVFGSELQNNAAWGVVEYISRMYAGLTGFGPRPVNQ